jgi:preprotein translocase subunit SecG
MYEILLVVHVVISVMLIGLILIQHGKGAQTGAAFGSGASQTVFGSQGSGGFLSRATAILAALFFLLNLFLVFWVNKVARPGNIDAPVSHATPTSQVEEPINKRKSHSSEMPAGTDIPAEE